LKILKEIPVEQVLALYPQKGSRKALGLKITQIPRNSVFSILRALKNCDIVVGGGGGIFQDETSGKSFSYYDFIVTTALHFRKPVYLLGQGLGDIHSSYHFRRLRKILSNPSCFGYFRDEISYRYAKRCYRHHVRATDLTYGILSNRDKIPVNPEKIGLMLKQPVSEEDTKAFIEPLKIDGIKSIDLLVSFPSEEMKSALRLSAILSNHFDVHIRQTEGGQLIDDIASCRLIITERLHGVIVSSFYGIPFLACNSFKIKAFLRDFKEYRGFYTHFDRMEIWGALTELKKIDFKMLNASFVARNIERYQEMVKSFTGIFSK
jgi:polysaccharide pyruvyl transferase WcaK-like protein